MARRITTAEAADILGVNASRVRQLVLAGRLRPERFGRALSLDADEVRKFARQARPSGRPRKAS